MSWPVRITPRPRGAATVAFTGLVLVASAVPELSAQHAERRLVPVRAYSEPFSELTSLRVLSDGRVIALDGREQVVHLVDVVRGTARTIGRVGSGPGEYRRGTALLPGRGDTTLLVDGGNARLLVIAPDGRLPAVIGPMERSPLALASASDGAGHVFATAALDVDAPVSEKAPDSVRLARIDLSTRRVETVLTLAAPPARISITRTGNEIQSVQIRRQPFAVGDAFAVAPDGRIAIARRSPYRLDQVMPNGRLVRGPAVPVTPVPVGEEEREEYLANLARRPSPELLDWPTELPPFPAQGVIALPNGETWVRRHVAARRDSAWYDVFDARGRVVARLPVAKRERILAVTSRTVYLARADEDGLVHLEVATVR